MRSSLLSHKAYDGALDGSLSQAEWVARWRRPAADASPPPAVGIWRLPVDVDAVAWLERGAELTFSGVFWVKLELPEGLAEDAKTSELLARGEAWNAFVCLGLRCALRRFFERVHRLRPLSHALYTAAQTCA